MLDRDELEALAKTTISSELYWDLQDTIDEVSDAELLHIIKCNGDYKLEIAPYQATMPMD